MTRCVLILLAFVFTPMARPAAEPGKGLRGPWRVGENDFVHYQLDVTKYGDGAETDATLPQPMRSAFGFFGYELKDGERPTRAMFDEEWAVFPYVFWMPRALAGGSKSVDVQDRFEGYGQMHAHVLATGKIAAMSVRTNGEAKEVDLMGAVALEIVAHPDYQPPANARPGTGMLHWRATFDVTAGIMRKVTFRLALDRAIVAARPNGSIDRKQNRMTFEGTLTFKRRLAYRYPTFEDDVSKAIDRGVDALRSVSNPQAKAHHPSGRTALVLLAMIKGGAKRTDVELQKLVDWLCPRQPEGVYSVGLVLAALEAWGAPERELGLGEKQATREHGTRVLSDAERQTAQRLADYLMEHAQIGEHPAPAATGQEPPKRRRGKRKRRPETVTGDHGFIRWGYPASHRGAQPAAAGAQPHWDNSNSQYAVLGLHAASLCAARVPRHAWFRVLGHFLHHQRADGPARAKFRLLDAQSDRAQYGTSTRYASDTRSRGWGYGWLYGDERRTFTAAYGSMTCAGISSLAIADGALVRTGAGGYSDSERRRVRDAIRDGFAFLDENWSSWANPLQGRYYYHYYLYGLERAAMLTGVKWIGTHDWYWEGAVHLLLSQQDRGTWDNDSIRTAFSVLFLKRGTKPVITPR